MRHLISRRGWLSGDTLAWSVDVTRDTLAATANTIGREFMWRTEDGALRMAWRTIGGGLDVELLEVNRAKKHRNMISLERLKTPVDIALVL